MNVGPPSRSPTEQSALKSTDAFTKIRGGSGLVMKQAIGVARTFTRRDVLSVRPSVAHRESHRVETSRAEQVLDAPPLSRGSIAEVPLIGGDGRRSGAGSVEDDRTSGIDVRDRVGHEAGADRCRVRRVGRSRRSRHRQRRSARRWPASAAGASNDAERRPRDAAGPDSHRVESHGKLALFVRRPPHPDSLDELRSPRPARRDSRP